MPKYVILKHEVGAEFSRQALSSAGQGDHLDWMFQHDDVLLTWATNVIDLTEIDLANRCLQVAAMQLVDHRIEYLEIQGDIGKNRGTVTRIHEGEFRLIEKSDNLFVAELQWNDQVTEIAIRPSGDQRSEDADDDDDWELVLSMFR